MSVLNQPITIPLHWKLPSLSETYEDTPDNRERVSDDVSNLYTYFLTPEAHQETQYQRFRQMGICICSASETSNFPDNQQVYRFRNALKERIQRIFNQASSLSIISLRVNIHSQSLDVLSEVMEETGLTPRHGEFNYHHLLPLYSVGTISIQPGKQIDLFFDLYEH